MEISKYLCEILNESIDKVIKNKIAITIELNPESESIRIEPWESFKYICPYDRGNFKEDKNE